MTVTPIDSANISPGTGGAIAAGKEINIASRAVTGGVLYITTVRGDGDSDPQGVATSFVATGTVPAVRYAKLSDGKSDLGVPLTAAAGTPSGTVGILRTAGSLLNLFGETTSGAQTKTNKVIFEFSLPDAYVAGAAIPVLVNCVVATATDVTAATTLMTLAAYSETAAGVEAALAVTAAQQIPITTPALLTFSVTGTGLVPGQRVVLELTMAVTTTTGGASFGQINSVGYSA